MTKETNVTHSMLRKPVAGAKATVPQNQKVYVVEPPSTVSLSDVFDADIEFAKRAAESAALEPDDSAVDLNDPAIQAQVKRHDTFQKLMYFKQPMNTSFAIDGMNFKLKILSPIDMAEVSKIFNSLPEDEQTIYRQRLMQLAGALMDIDGVKLEDVYHGPEASVYMKRYSEIIQWPNPLISNILTQYEDFALQVKDRYLPDFLKQPKAEGKG